MEIRGLLVDTFLSKSINVAHSLARKAEECEKLGESKNAIECHGKAASIMDEILKEEGIDFQVTLSLKLQCKYHENRIKFLTAVDDFEKNEEEAKSDSSLDATGESNDAKPQNDGATNFSLLKEQIKIGSSKELRGISTKLLELVKMQQEQILYLSQQLQMINAEKIRLKKATVDK